MHSITHVGVLSCGKIAGLTAVVITFVCAIPYALLAMAVGIGSNGAGMGTAGMGIGAALGMVIVAPLGFGALHFIAGLMYAVVLNFVLRKTGGLELSIEKITPPGTPPPAIGIVKPEL